MEEKLVGKIILYYAAGRVAKVKLTRTLRVGDYIHIKGSTTDFNQRVSHLYRNQEPIKEAKAGQKDIWLGVKKRVNKDDKVFVIIIEVSETKPVDTDTIVGPEPDIKPPPKPPTSKPNVPEPPQPPSQEVPKDKPNLPDDWDDIWEDGKKRKKRRGCDKGGGPGG